MDRSYRNNQIENTEEIEIYSKYEEEIQKLELFINKTNDKCRFKNYFIPFILVLVSVSVSV